MVGDLKYIFPVVFQDETEPCPMIQESKTALVGQKGTNKQVLEFLKSQLWPLGSHANLRCDLTPELSRAAERCWLE